jgi:hypothetical protein
MGYLYWLYVVLLVKKGDLRFEVEVGYKRDIHSVACRDFMGDPRHRLL